MAFVAWSAKYFFVLIFDPVLDKYKPRYLYSSTCSKTMSPILKFRLFNRRPLPIIMILVLSVFIFNFQISQYVLKASNACCNSSALSLNITVSSAYKSMNNFTYTRSPSIVLSCVIPVIPWSLS